MSHAVDLDNGKKGAEQEKGGEREDGGGAIARSGGVDPHSPPPAPPFALTSLKQRAVEEAGQRPSQF